MKSILILLALIGGLAIQSGTAGAVEKSELTKFKAGNTKGTWYFYVDVSNGPTNAVLECEIGVQKKGKVRPKNNACSARTTSIIDTLDVESGSIKVNNAGKVSGEFCLSTSCYDIIDARMTKNKQVIDGIGINGSGSVFSFTAVKR